MPKLKKDGLTDVEVQNPVDANTTDDMTDDYQNDVEGNYAEVEMSDAFATDPELVRIQEVFTELVTASSTVNYEKVSTHSLDGESFVTLRLDPKAFEAMRKILITLRTEYQLTLV